MKARYKRIGDRWTVELIPESDADRLATQILTRNIPDVSLGVGSLDPASLLVYIPDRWDDYPELEESLEHERDRSAYIDMKRLISAHGYQYNIFTQRDITRVRIWNGSCAEVFFGETPGYLLQEVRHFLEGSD